MRVCFWMALLVLMVFSAFQASAADAPKAPQLRCDTGPVTKQYGGVSWLVYSCEDEKSLVIFSTSDSPAMPFYYLVTHSATGYHLYGEGTGDKHVTDAAFEEIKQLTEGEIESLVKETRTIAAHK